MRLAAGDLILTGTPAGVGKLVPGDEIRVAVEGLGEVTNKIA
jgi:2-keto-4-pentenoate hydratase/2-oxohepta-3-ene-1,7-dioic acid hydratase in catechol pathway